tara:strand:- start:239 stop:892 length:654 start_codon:yes stop_codon:yes gene_type:complete
VYTKYNFDLKNAAKVDYSKDIIFIDCESTKPTFDKPKRYVIEAAAVKADGTILVNEVLKQPEEYFRYYQNHKLNVGIHDEDIRNAKRTWHEVQKIIIELSRSNIVVAFNMNYERELFHNLLTSAFSASCCMERFSERYGKWNNYHSNHEYVGLSTAAEYFNIKFNGPQHRALPDAEVTRQIWLKLEQQGDEQEQQNKSNNILDYSKTHKLKRYSING